MGTEVDKTSQTIIQSIFFLLTTVVLLKSLATCMCSRENTSRYEARTVLWENELLRRW